MKHWPTVYYHVAALALALGGMCAVANPPRPALAADQDVPVPVRIFASAPDGSWAASGFISYRELIARLAQQDVVFLGEQHDDPATHQMEAAVLSAVNDAIRLKTDERRPVVLSLEMFERDVQRQLELYLNGMITEQDFLAASRPWPNYDPDYRRMIEYACWHELPVVAANIPRPLASRVAKEGFEAAWAGYTDEERQWVAQETSAPEDLYWTLFNQLMGGGGHGEGGMDEATVKNFYAAQCIKDDTMAESIVRAREGRNTGLEEIVTATSPQAPVAGPLVVHVNGSFHSDYRQGTAARVLKRRPGDRVVTIAFLPADDFNALPRWPEALCLINDAAEEVDPSAEPAEPVYYLADYIVFVPSPYFGSDEAVPVAGRELPEEEPMDMEEMPVMPAMPATPPPGMPMPPK